MEAAESSEATANDRSDNRRGPDRESRTAVILGNDALVAARPCTPAQLTHACHAAGFEVVIPPSWGDELVADAYLARLRGCVEHVAVACACPRVRSLIDRDKPVGSACAASVAAPPVAASRYLRATHDGPLLITFVGDCPSAGDQEINARFSPQGFFASLERQGISLAAQPTTVSEAESARWLRFRSVPGGLPALRWLARAPIDRLLRESSDGRVDTAHWEATSKSKVLLDLTDAAACACGANRAQIEEWESGRSVSPVVMAPASLDLTPAAGLVSSEVQPPTPLIHEPTDGAIGLPPASHDAGLTAAAAPQAAPVVSQTKRRRAVLAALPVAVIAIAAALGGAAYAVASTEQPAARATGSPLVPDTAPVSGASGRQGSTSAASRSQPPQIDRVRAETTNVDADSAGSATGRRTARKARPEVVPGWLPQGRPAWTAGDTGRSPRPRRPASPPTASPSPTKPDTIPET